MLTSIISKIPANGEMFFVIKKGDWNYSVDVEFEHKYKLNTLNLYYILKSYIIKDETLIKWFFLTSRFNENSKTVTRYKIILPKKIKYMNYLDFKIFFEEIYEEYYHYFENEKYVGFRIVFYSCSIYWENGSIYPIYPWKNEFLEIVNKNHSSNIFFDYSSEQSKKIHELEKINQNLLDMLNKKKK
jgi:hypothetical protein